MLKCIYKEQTKLLGFYPILTFSTQTNAKEVSTEIGMQTKSLLLLHPRT